MADLMQNKPRPPGTASQPRRDVFDRIRRRIETYRRHDGHRLQRHVDHTLKQTKEREHTRLLRQKWLATRVKRQKQVSSVAQTTPATTPATTHSTSSTNCAGGTQPVTPITTSLKTPAQMHPPQSLKTTKAHANAETSMPISESLDIGPNTVRNVAESSHSPVAVTAAVATLTATSATAHLPSSLQLTGHASYATPVAPPPPATTATSTPATTCKTAAVPLLPLAPPEDAAGVVSSPVNQPSESDQIGIADVDELQAILDTLENENNRRQFSSFPAETVTQDVSADQRVKTEAGFTATPIHRLYNDAETGPNTALKQSHSPQFKQNPMELNKSPYATDMFQQNLYQGYDQHYTQNKIPVASYGKTQYTTQQSYPPQVFGGQYNGTAYADLSVATPLATPTAAQHSYAAARRYSTEYYSSPHVNGPLQTMQQMVNLPTARAVTRPSRRKTSAVPPAAQNPGAAYPGQPQRSPNVTVGAIGGLGRTPQQWAYSNPQATPPGAGYATYRYPAYQPTPAVPPTNYYSAPPAVQRVPEFNLIEDIFPNH